MPSICPICLPNLHHHQLSIQGCKIPVVHTHMKSCGYRPSFCSQFSVVGQMGRHEGKAQYCCHFPAHAWDLPGNMSSDFTQLHATMRFPAARTLSQREVGIPILCSVLHILAQFSPNVPILPNTQNFCNPAFLNTMPFLYVLFPNACICMPLSP